ncbi:MAG: sulfate ABC transporter permease subunit CysT [bacterium]
MKSFLKKNNVLPGFAPSLGFTLFYLTLLVLIPLSTLVWKTTGMGWTEFWETVTSPRVLASFRLSFGASLAAAFINTFFGMIVAWVLVRYRFPGKAIVDLLVDLPFALPTAVAGIALTTAFSAKGLIGRFLEPLGVKVLFNPIGVTIALVFIGLPFVVRSVQPVLKDFDRDMEEASACLGAKRYQTFFQVILPSLIPALASGFTMAFARALGEYGSVVFISGNLPLKTEITPFVIMTKLENYDYAGATAIATVMLFISFAILWLINRLQPTQTGGRG